MTRCIGYVSIPFGKKNGADFTEIYKTAIFPAPTIAATSESIGQVILFREDEKVPELDERHWRRLKESGLDGHPTEPALREEIQRHIILADFVIADFSHLNTNVMLEVGFAQAARKPIIYISHTRDLWPSNLNNLKRIYYQQADLSTLKLNLWNRIQEVVLQVRDTENALLQRGGRIEYARERRDIRLDDRFSSAERIIQILTTNLTTVSADFLTAITTALDCAKSERRKLEVTILTSDPKNPFIQPRADQLEEDKEGYRNELEGSLRSIAARLKRYPNCEIFTYKDFPVQLWHRIDGTIYLGNLSLTSRARRNCVFAVDVHIPGIKQTFLDHFERLKKRATRYRK